MGRNHLALSQERDIEDENDENQKASPWVACGKSTPGRSNRAKSGREAGGSSGQPDEASVAEPGARRGRGRGSLAGPVESPPRKELGFSSKCNGKPPKGVYVRSDMLWSAAPSHPPEG